MDEKEVGREFSIEMVGMAIPFFGFLYRMVGELRRIINYREE